MKFRLFGTKIEISFLFLAILCLVIFTDKSGFIIPVVIASALHEIAHLLCMRFLDCQPKAIRLIPASVEVRRKFCCSWKSETLISFSGPFINILLFLFFSSINLPFAVINLIIGCFNLLPVKGLDGGDIAVKLLSLRCGEQKAVRILNIMNFAFGIIGIFLGVILIINDTPNISVIIMSIYLLLSIIIKL